MSVGLVQAADMFTAGVVGRNFSKLERDLTHQFWLGLHIPPVVFLALVQPWGPECRTFSRLRPRRSKHALTRIQERRRAAPRDAFSLSVNIRKDAGE